MCCHERWLLEKWNCACSARPVFGGGAFGAGSRNEICLGPGAYCWVWAMSCMVYIGYLYWYNKEYNVEFYVVFLLACQIYQSFMTRKIIVQGPLSKFRGCSRLLSRSVAFHVWCPAICHLSLLLHPHPPQELESRKEEIFHLENQIKELKRRRAGKNAP